VKRERAANDIVSVIGPVVGGILMDVGAATVGEVALDEAEWFELFVCAALAVRG
jgi:hypothetical protein